MPAAARDAETMREELLQYLTDRGWVPIAELARWMRANGWTDGQGKSDLHKLYKDGAIDRRRTVFGGGAYRYEYKLLTIGWEDPVWPVADTVLRVPCPTCGAAAFLTCYVSPNLPEVEAGTWTHERRLVASSDAWIAEDPAARSWIEVEP